MTIELVNFRELGGIKTKDKRKIKHGLFYRGPAFMTSRLSFPERQELDDIGFKHIVDFRGHEEVDRGSGLYLPKGAIYHHEPAIRAFDDIDDDLDTTETSKTTFEDDYMIRVYRILPHKNKAYKLLFDFIKNDEVPLYFHCSAGKDRTGVFACLLELLLGVSEEEIIKDYMISKTNYEKYYAEMFGMKYINDSWLCDESWIKAAMSGILFKYQNYEEYFKAEYDITSDDIKDIRDRYLEY